MEISYFEDVMFPKTISPYPEKNLKFVKNLDYKEGDILICSYPKSGSHWMENILRCMIRSDNKTKTMESMALIDFSTRDILEAMPSPRIFFTHLLPNRLPAEHVQNRGKIALLLRNPKDICVSAFHHLRRSVIIVNTQSQEDHFESYITGMVPYGDVFSYYYAWQEAIKENRFDISYFYYEDLKDYPVQTLSRLARHLGVTKTDEDLNAIVKECSIDSLRSKAILESIPRHLLDEHKEMIIYRKGQIGDWKNHFTVAQNERYDQIMAEKMKNITMFDFRFQSIVAVEELDIFEGRKMC